MRHLSALALAALLAVLAAGCGRTVNRAAERRIRDALPTAVGPAKSWTAHVDNPPERTVGGKLRRVVIDGQDVRLRQAITCASLHLELTDVKVDVGRGQLKSVGSTTFEAVISEQALNDYLRAAPPPADTPVRIKRVRLRNGQLYAEGTRELLGRAWAFTMTVRPRLASPTRLAFDAQRMSVVGLRVPLPASVLTYLARRLDSGFDFSTLPFPVHIVHFRVSSGTIHVAGSADVMGFINEHWEEPARK